MSCVSEAAKARARAYNREYARKQRLEHPEKVAASLKAWRSRNRELVLNDKRLYRERHPKRVAASLKRWRIENLDAARAQQKAFYNACPKGSEVDHILPLQEETISGLHVLDNLQYLSMPENRAKGNKI